MGEVPFAAVLHWVTRIDDFKLLLEDLSERERTVHLARNMEAAHTYMKWYAQPNQCRDIAQAWDFISDHCCSIFLGQINLLPHYTTTAQPYEGEHRVWNVARLNCPSPVYRKVIWYATSPFPLCDDMFHRSVGCPCVHQLCVLASLEKPLFARDYFHCHWARQTSVRLAPPILDTFQPSVTAVHHHSTNPLESVSCQASPAPEHPTTQTSQLGSLSADSVSTYHMQQLSPTPALSLSVPKPHDKVNSGKLHQTFKRICDLTTRPAAKKKGLDQRFYDTLKNIAHQLEISTGISECGSHVQFNPPCSGTIRTLFSPEQPAITSVSMPPNSEARPQTVRKRSRHEPHKTPASLCPSINSNTTVTEVPTSHLSLYTTKHTCVYINISITSTMY